MTLDKHQIDGLSEFLSKPLPATEFEARLIAAGYSQIGSAPAQGGRLKIWWTHLEYRGIESIYSGVSLPLITFHKLKHCSRDEIDF